jgi:hypothetical protein
VVSQDNLSLSMYVYPYCVSRSRCTVLTRRSLLIFLQLRGLVIRHPPSLSPTVLYHTLTIHVAVLSPPSTSSSINTPALPELRRSSCRLCLTLRLPLRSTSIRLFFQQYSLYLADHDMRKLFLVARSLQRFRTYPPVHYAGS